MKQIGQNLPVMLVIVTVIAAIFGSASTLAIQSWKKPSTKELIKEFYLIENAVYVSPHSIRRDMDKGKQNYVLVDLRSAEEYEKAHVIGAINIPAYKDANTSAYDEVDRIVNAFRALPKDKDVVVYCYSMPCMTGRKIGKMLVENDIYVKHLGIGWNEWRYYWNLWNHDGETASRVEDYIVGGKEPGKAVTRELPSPCGEGELSC